MMLVTLNTPLASKVLVESTVQFARGVATFVEVNT